MRWRALWLAGGWSIAAAIVWLSLTESPPKLGFQQGDKIGHFVAYGTLMYWFCQLYAAAPARIAHAAGFAAMGVALEFIQGALGYRSFEVFDMVANSLGVLLGWALAAATGAGLFVRIESPIARR